MRVQIHRSPWRISMTKYRINSSSEQKSVNNQQSNDNSKMWEISSGSID